NAINTTRPSATVETVTMTNDASRNNASVNAGFYFYGSGDSLAYADDWKTRYSFIEGGIYVNDALISGAQLIKIDASNLYYVAFDNCGVTPFADGTAVRVAGTVKNGYFDQVVFEEKTFIYKATSGWKEKAFVGTLELLNASAMMGGSYGSAIYYDLSGTYGSANWIINAVPTAGDIHLEYVLKSEDRTAGGVFGVARLFDLSDNWVTNTGGAAFTINNTANTFATSFGTSHKFDYSVTEHDYRFNNVYLNNDFATSKAVNEADVVTMFTELDAKGAPYFGLYWGGGTYKFDMTKLMIYDAEGNDLGVQWHDNAANAALSMMVEYGKTAYVKALPKTDKFGTTLAVIGWKGYDSEGNELTVTATENNGVWSFVVPQDLAKLEPQYQTTSLTITVGGQTIKTDDVLWTDDALANAGVFAGEGQKLLGYIYNGNLYSSLSDINTASAAEVVIEAMMVEFEVQTKEEIRYGADMYNSGLRFIATLTNLYDGVHVVEKGFLLTTMDKAKAGLTLETEGVLKISSQNAAYSEIDSVDDTASYSIALTNIKAENYNLPYAARAYFVVEYADGTRQTIYSTFDSEENATTVFNVASASNGAVPQAYEDGFIDITADGDLIGDRSYTISFDKNSYIVTYDYTPAVTGATFVKSFSLNSVRMTTADGVIFEDGKITIPSGLFAMSLLEKELKPVRALSFNAYGGPSSGWALKTDKYGNQTEYQYERSTVEDLKDYFDAGFTVWSADDWWAGQDKDGNGKEDHLDALDLMAEYCLTYNKDPKDYKVILHDSYLWGLMSGEDMINGNEEFSYRTTEWSAQFMKARIFGTGVGDFGNILGYANYVPVVNGVEYPELNCFGGLALRDEPHIEHMETMAEWFNYLAADTDESVTVSSVLSNGDTGTHTTNALGMLKQGYELYFSMISPQAEKKYVVRYSISEEPCTPAQYENYANTFIDAVNASCWEYDNMYLAFNCYPYLVNYTISKDGMFGSTTTTKNQFYLSTALAEPYFWANRYRDKDVRLMTAIQSFAFDRLSQLDRNAPLFGGSVTTLNSTDVMLSAAEVQAQVYQGLVNGIQEFNYFTYWRHYNGNVYKGETHTQSAVYYDSNGNAVKDEMYYWVKDTNQEVLKFKDLYTSFDWEEAGYFAGTETQSNLTNMDDLLTGAANVLNASALKAVSGSVDTMVGYFTKAEGDFRSAFMVANGHNARELKTDNVTLTFDEGSNVTDVIVYLDGAPKMMSVSGGQVTLTLASGEGAFVIPVIG
ncbi:MAG: hypothetical protein IIX68_04405, partial [Clostridia bacterium]|nr:hypothetical protein [Clostridia bacterium]